MGIFTVCPISFKSAHQDRARYGVDGLRFMDARIPGTVQNDWRVDRARMPRNLICDGLVNFDTF